MPAIRSAIRSAIASVKWAYTFALVPRAAARMAAD
jgi:hypothetical protein